MKNLRAELKDYLDKIAEEIIDSGIQVYCEHPKWSELNTEEEREYVYEQWCRYYAGEPPL